MTNMKKILFGLGTVTTVVAPVAAVVACGSDDSKNKNTGYLADEIVVYNADELENLFNKELIGGQTLIVDKDVLFTTLLAGSTGALELNVYQGTKEDSKAILVKGNAATQADATKYLADAELSNIKNEFGIKAEDLKKGAFVVLVKNFRVSIYDVLANGTTTGLSKVADESFSVH